MTTTTSYEPAGVIERALTFIGCSLAALQFHSVKLTAVATVVVVCVVLWFTLEVATTSGFGT